MILIVRVSERRTVTLWKVKPLIPPWSRGMYTAQVIGWANNGQQCRYSYIWVR